MARGARASRAGTAALLQPFQPLWIGLAGRGEVRTLTRAEAAGAALPLRGLALPCGFYLNELLVRVVGRGDPHDALFGLYCGVLAEVAGGAHLASALRRFELALLGELGYAPTLAVQEDGSPVRPGGCYRVSPGEAPAPAPVDGPGPLVSGATLLALAAGAPLAAHQQPEARALLSALLAPHLGVRPLASRELLRRWQALRAAAPDPGEFAGESAGAGADAADRPPGP